MLLRFGVSNHRSIRDYQELFLSASKRIRREDLTLPVPTLRESAVPVAAIYGPNAAGKSNLVEAMGDMQWAIAQSHRSLGATQGIPRNPFRLDDSGVARLTRFDCTFTVDKGGAGEREPNESESVYEYGFEYTATEFRREWLYRMARRERQSTRVVFERKTEDGRVHVRFGVHLRGENRVVANLTRPNSLFLSAAAQNNHPQLTNLYRYFAERWKVILGEGIMGDAEVALRLYNYEHLDRFLNLVRQADVGISGFDIEDEERDGDQDPFTRGVVRHLSELARAYGASGLPSGPTLVEMHERKRVRFVHSGVGGGATALDYGMESKGTRTLISLLLPALDALSQGGLFVVDELDTSLHPDLARAFVSLFNKKASNPHGAQIIFTTHDVSLLGSGLLRQDKIWMTDKTQEGVSRFTPLTEFKLRSRDDIEKAYRHGRLGGVPAGDDFFIDFDDDHDALEP